MTDTSVSGDLLRAELHGLRSGGDVVLIGSPSTALLSVAGRLGLTTTTTLPAWDPDSMCRRLEPVGTPLWDREGGCFISPTRGDYWFGRPRERLASIETVIEILVGRRDDPTVIKRAIVRSPNSAPRVLWPTP